MYVVQAMLHGGTKCLRDIHRGQNALPWIHFAERIILSLVDRHFVLRLSLLVAQNLDFGSKNEVRSWHSFIPLRLDPCMRWGATTYECE
jgi:hypothetical protein